MTVVTRFAPSPTGFLHIGGARTALFNWLYARHTGGKFLLRIEDTDRQRSTPEATAAILDGLRWLELDWDGPEVYQFARAARHAEVAHEMLAKGQAYYCYTTPEELTAMREAARAAGKPMRYDGRWRDRDPKEAPAGVKPVIRLKAPTSGETIIEDLVQGTVRVANDQLDDMVLLRGDGTPTYMLSVVVDDHDMNITHVIRGDDHLTNAFRQTQIYLAMGWQPPSFSHIPLIHGADGAKLSKRHGAIGLEQYRDMGMLPEAMRNYLMRLGWGHGDSEIISTDQAIEWFDVVDVGRSASRFDMVRLVNLNGHYIRTADDERLTRLTLPFVEKLIGGPVSEDAAARIRRGMQGLKERTKTLIELAETGAFYARRRPIPINDKARKLLSDDAVAMLRRLLDRLRAVEPWTQASLDAAVRACAEAEGRKLGDVAQPLRAAVTGSNISPSMFEVMEILGKNESLGRLQDALG
ncbi:MAG: glutamate--tRNA ligase [Alphaproteobacteria bacterium]